MRYLHSLGVKTIINLEDSENIKKMEENLAKKFRMTVISPWLHVKSPPLRWECPSKEDLHEVVNIIEKEIQIGNPIYVHCFQGVDRTGMVIAAYRVIVQKWDPEGAISEWKQVVEKATIPLSEWQNWYNCFLNFPVIKHILSHRQKISSSTTCSQEANKLLERIDNWIKGMRNLGIPQFPGLFVAKETKEIYRSAVDYWLLSLIYAQEARSFITENCDVPNARKYFNRALEVKLTKL